MQMQHDGPTDVHVRFFEDAFENERKTAVEGRPVFDRIEMVEIRIPGDRRTKFVAPAHQKVYVGGEWLSYVQRFPRHYELFRAGHEALVDGTPLSEAPFLSAERRKSLLAQNVQTIEQLAGMEGAHLQALGPGAYDMKAAAKRYLAGADKVKAAAELDALRKELEELRGMLKAPPAERLPAPAQDGEILQGDEETMDAFFEDMEDDELREFIEKQTGHECRLRSREKLIAAAKEAMA